ncbi:hypothetical protein OR573_12000 [Halomonas sp. CH40]
MSESIEALTQQAATLKAELASKEESLKQMQVQQQAMGDSMATLQQTLAGLEEKINALAGQSQEAVAGAGEAGEEAKKPVAIVSDAPYPQEKLDSFVVLKVLQEERERLLPYIQMIRDSEFFDGAWYLEQYPDLKDSDFADDPAMHYLLFGGFEGRPAGPLFNSMAYYLEYPDVYNNQLNPLLHFIMRGIEEGRTAYPLAK